MENLAPDWVAGRSLDLEFESMRSDGGSRWLIAQQNPGSHGNADYYENTRSNLVFSLCGRGFCSGEGSILSVSNAIDITTPFQG